MCGILAIVDFRNRPVKPETVARLRDTMFHRGPDDEGLYVEGPVGLGHRRLSIIDLTRAGHQPMTNEDGSLQLVFNGEIYNYIELREQLLARGHRFHSSTDTEVILHQYEEDGERCVEKFRGMFAFAIWDSRKQTLFAARDRFGIKPLYFYHDEYKCVMASEIKAIVEDEEIPRRPDMRAIADYMYAGRALGGKTMFRDIVELDPGCSVTIDRRAGTVDVRKYWSLPYNYNRSRTDAQTLEQLAAIVDESVAIHCRSDAPLGCHLSGGIDSSSVVAMASRHRQHLSTFSIKFSEDVHIDETRFAKAVAAHVGAQYLECSPTAVDMAEVLPFLVWHMDVPMATEGGFAYFTVSEFAKRYVKVSLTGHGGDEIFAGYPAQFQATFNTTEMFRLYDDPVRIPPPPSVLTKALKKGPLGIYKALRARAGNRRRSLEDQWAALHCEHLPSDNPLLHQRFVAGLAGYSPRAPYIEPFANAPTDETLDRCLYHDLTVYLPSLLHLEDRVSMAVSLESRVPLLDHRIVEFLATVPPDQKVRGLQPKHLLRQLSSSLLPKEIWANRDKRPFGVPGTFWRTRQLHDFAKQILLSQESLERGIFRPEALRAACADDGQVILFWSLVNVELWFKIFIDQNPFWIQKARDRAAAISDS